MPYTDCNAKACYNGYVDCRPCDGEGYFDCSACGGYGIYPDSGKPCKKCGGDRRIACRKCSGSGKLPCRKCDGSGQFYTKWAKKRCEWSSGCYNDVDYNEEWSNPPKFCDLHKEEMKQIREAKAKREAETVHKRCKRDECGQDFSYHQSKGSFDYCRDCSKVIYQRYDYKDLCFGTDMDDYLAGAKGGSVKESDRGAEWRHVTLYTDGGRVSGDINIFTKSMLGFHATLTGYDSKGKQKKAWNLHLPKDLK